MPARTPAPVTVEDREADVELRRLRAAGTLWWSVALLAFGLGLMARDWRELVAAWALAASCYILGLRRREREFDRATSRLGDATMQRARWRTVGDVSRSRRILGSLVIVLVLLGVETWRW